MGRYLISAILGGIMTLALAYLMQILIFTPYEPPEEYEPIPTIVITMEEPDPDPEPAPPPRPSVEDQPPPPPTLDPGNNDAPEFEIVVPALPPVEGPTTGHIIMTLTPIVTVPPEYPRGALTRGTEGYVVVGFDVNAEGNTQNARVISSDPPNTFDNAALSSIAGWRYQPQTDDEGNPITVHGQRTRIVFVLSGEGGE